MALFRAQSRVSDCSNSRMKDSWVLLCTIQCILQIDDKSILVVSRYTNLPNIVQVAEPLARIQLVPLFTSLVRSGTQGIEPRTYRV